VILVATSTEAPVGVFGSVGGVRLSAPSRAVAPGAIAAFRLSFTRPLRSRLAKLSRNRSLNLRVTAEGHNVAGLPAADRLTVKLRGQSRPATSRNTARG
jgi:hypothetical protein